VHLAYIWIVSHLSAKNYRNWWEFDEVLTKTNLLSFLGHGVFLTLITSSAGALELDSMLWRLRSQRVIIIIIIIRRSQV